MRKRTLETSFGASLAVSLAVALGACTPPGGPARNPEPASESLGTSQQPLSVAPRSAAPPSPAASSQGGGALRPLVGIEDAAGRGVDSHDPAFASVGERMSECGAGRKGVVRVRIRTDKNRTSMDVEPDSSLGGTTSRCVLETLSTVDVEDVLSRSSPSDRPSGFTSVLRVEW